MIIFDITNKDNSMNFLSNFTSIQREDILSFVKGNIIQTNICTDAKNVTADNFCNTFNIDIEDLDVNDVMLCAIHYTTNNDENHSIKEFGLRDLQFALSNNTPLNNFLNEYGISFDIEKKTMLANGNEYNIEFVNYCADNPVTHIARKVYYDNQVSCFFYIEDINDYLGCVHLRPEILYNIDELLKTDLSRKWYKSCKGYGIKFYAKISDFTEYSFPNERKTIAENLIDMSLSVISDCACGEIFAYLKPDTIISFDNILEINEI